MLSTLVSFLTLAALATASPLAERQSGVQVVRNCNNQGQVALTFDGKSLLHSLPVPTEERLVIETELMNRRSIHLRKRRRRSFERW
jgi:hypothetical protein